eukprot:scaffold266597_cov24-Tisochrysis_lutea.AAC.4
MACYVRRSERDHKDTQTHRRHDSIEKLVQRYAGCQSAQARVSADSKSGPEQRSVRTHARHATTRAAGAPRRCTRPLLTAHRRRWEAPVRLLR